MSNTKQTELPSGWELNAIKSLGKVSSGGTPDTTNEDYWNGGINWCTPTDITKLNGSKYIGETKVKISEKGLRTSSAILLPKGSLIVCTRASIGNAAISVEEISTNQGFKNIVPELSKSNVDFLYYTILNSKHKLTCLGNGSTFLEISKTDFENFKIPTPPLPEQRAIAKILSTWDSAIQTTQDLISQKEAEKKWLMQNLLTGKKRLKGFSGEWREQKLSELFERVIRKNNEGNTTVVTISAQRGFIRQTDFFNKNIASEVTENYFLVEKGEFCYNKSYSNGYPWGATKRLKDFDKAVVTTLYICFGVKNEKETNPEFFEQYFNANKLDSGLMKIAHEGGRAHGLLNVTPSDFFSLKVTIPNIKEQTAIAQVLQTADKEITLLKTKLEQQKLQKKVNLFLWFDNRHFFDYNKSPLERLHFGFFAYG